MGLGLPKPVMPPESSLRTCTMQLDKPWGSLGLRDTKPSIGMMPGSRGGLEGLGFRVSGLAVSGLGFRVPKIRHRSHSSTSSGSRPQSDAGTPKITRRVAPLTCQRCFGLWARDVKM